MNVTNFKTQTEIKMQIELDAWKAGEKKWGMASQFDESILESAMKNIDMMADEQWEWWMNAQAGQNVMAIAHALSQFEAPEIDGAWVN
jgi:hypothetical protein